MLKLCKVFFLFALTDVRRPVYRIILLNRHYNKWYLVQECVDLRQSFCEEDPTPCFFVFLFIVGMLKKLLYVTYVTSILL